MFRYLAILILTLFTTFAHANAFEDADAAWRPGQPWPEHWGKLIFPWEKGWNVILVGFVNKVYAENEAQGSAVNDIPYAMAKDHTVEICMIKKGVFNWATTCMPALVDPEVVGTLQNGDIIAMFHPKDGASKWSYKPGADGNHAMRVFQRIAGEEEAKDIGCWKNLAMIIKTPTEPPCLQRVNVQNAGRLLERDFGPRFPNSAPMPQAGLQAQ